MVGSSSIGGFVDEAAEFVDPVLEVLFVGHRRASGEAVQAGSGSGSLSGRLGALGAEEQERALTSLQVLPQMFGRLSYRTVVPVTAALRVRRPLNMLHAEVLAVALIVDGRVRTAVSSELLRSGAQDLRIDYQTLA